MPDPYTPLPPLPEARRIVRKKTPLSLVWIVPIVAALVGVWVAVTKIMSEGPTITIVLRTAEGLEAGKTKIRYNGVDVGTLTTIRLSDDHTRVVATAQMAPEARGFLLEDTRFWVVRARISGATVSGLGTLLSGAYVGMEIGQSLKSRRDFAALEQPPVVTVDVPGRYFKLKSPDLGSLDLGTPLYFRRLHVGEVVSYALAADGQSLDVAVFVNVPYDQYVTSNTRFWHASGVDVALSAAGLTVQTQSALSILIGGVAFETPATSPVASPAEANASFTLFANRAQAFEPPARDPQLYRLVFKQSVRGLAVGAPVEFQGVPIGEVAEIDAQMDAQTFEFSVPVTIRLDVERLGAKIVDLPPGMDRASERTKLVEGLVARGVRAQLQTGNLLTGALFVAFDTFPDAPAATIDWSQHPVQLPTIGGELEVIEASLTGILKKIEGLPLEGVVADLRKTLAGADQALASARGALDNASKMIAPSSGLSGEISGTLQEVSRAARSVRVLADYLERNPEALIRGKTGGAK
jgi:paraquat-inducible protein B